MSQDKYNKYCELVGLYKKYNLEDSMKQSELNKYITWIEKLLNDEYRYGSSRLDLYFLEKYMNKCEKLVQESGY
jgi:hypothetical protein